MSLRVESFLWIKLPLELELPTLGLQLARAATRLAPLPETFPFQFAVYACFVGGYEQTDVYQLSVTAHTRDEQSNVQYHFGYFLDDETDERFLTEPQLSATVGSEFIGFLSVFNRFRLPHTLQAGMRLRCRKLLTLENILNYHRTS